MSKNKGGRVNKLRGIKTSKNIDIVSYALEVIVNGVTTFVGSEPEGGLAPDSDHRSTCPLFFGLRICVYEFST